MTTEEARNRKPRCVFVWNYLSWGGAQMYMLGIARRLSDRMDVEFLMPSGSSERFIGMCTGAGIKCRFLSRHVSTVPAKGLSAKLRDHLSKVLSEFEIARQIISAEFDVVHADFGPWQSLSFLLILSLKARTFFTVHNRLPVVGRLRSLLWKLKFSLSGMTKRLHAFAANRDAKDSLRAYAGREYVEAVTVTYACINPDELREVRANGRESASIERLGIEKASRLIVTVGQFIDRKGRRLLLDVVPRVREVFSDARFLWITDSTVSTQDRALLSASESADCFRLIQMSESGLTRSELLEVVSSADVFVLPSLIEGLPIALLEAMALGVAVVASDINGIPEAVQHQENGLLVAPDDVAALENAILTLLRNDELRVRLGANASKMLDSDFSERAVAEVAYHEYCGERVS